MGRAEEPPAVIALLADPSLRDGLAAAFEEEAVPLDVRSAKGERLELARAAARLSRLGLGVGGDPGGLVLVLAAAPGRPYLVAPAASARPFGHAAARVAAHRPVGTGDPAAARASGTARAADGER